MDPQATTISEPRERAKPLPAKPVVYALLDAGQHVLYVGATTNLSNRLKAHRGRDWWEHVTTVSWMVAEMERRDRLDIESSAISSLCPPHNIHCNAGPLAAALIAENRRELLALRRRWPQIKMHRRPHLVWIDALANHRRPPKRFGWIDL